MTSKRPVLEIPKQTIDVVMDLFGAGCIVFMFVYGSLYYGSLPDTVPSKFGFDGTPTQWSPKPMLWLLPVIASLTWAGMYWLNKYPHIFNFPAKITEQNAFYQYQLATRFIRFLNLIIAIMFAYLFASMIQSALGNAGGLSVWLLPLFMIALFGAIIVYFYYSSTK